MRGLPAVAAVLAVMSVTASLAASATTDAHATDRARPLAAPTASTANAYRFLDQMMDLYASGSVPRLVQSFSGGALAKQHFTDSVTYDDALVIDAYLAEGTPEGLSRAETIGDALLYVQANDPAHDGRMRAAYTPTPLQSPSDVHPTEQNTDVGNMAWAGQALVHLYNASGDQAYLAGAQEIGDWVQSHCHDTRGAGGYTGGLKRKDKRVKWKSTEHNLDLFSLFTLLAEATGDSVWSTRAASAKAFVEAMWDRSEDRFYEGTANNGKKVNDTVRPEDVDSWSYLALGNPAYAASLDWDASNLSAGVGGFSGVSFCQGDRSGVWFEGTAHLADALELRGGPGDQAQADTYLAAIEYAQADGPNGNGLGIIAASKDKLSDCEGDFYYASLHTGATAWYLLAAAHVDPFL